MSAQYVAAYAAEHEDALDEEEPEPSQARPLARKTTFRRKKKVQTKPRKNTKVKKPAAKPKPAVRLPGKVDQKASNQSCSHYFNERFKVFLDGCKADGHSYKVAMELWTTSRERSDLLAGLSLAELERRKFMPKTCLQNPFAASFGGA